VDAAPAPDAIDWEALPVPMVLDDEFDHDDAETALGFARSMALTLQDEEGWLLV